MQYKPGRNILYNLYNKKVNRNASLKAFNKIKSKEYDAIRKHIPNFVKTFKSKLR